MADEKKPAKGPEKPSLHLNMKVVLPVALILGVFTAVLIGVLGNSAQQDRPAVQGERPQGPERAAPAAAQGDCPNFTSTLNVCRVTARSGSGWMRKAPGASGQWLWDIDDMSNLAEVWYLDGSGQERRYNLNGRDNGQAYAWRFVPKPGMAIAVRYRIG